MPETSTNSHTPKSVRQKRILSIAAEQPDASIAQIANEVATATKNVVENVLEEYGDPAEQATVEGQPSGATASSDGGQPLAGIEPSSKENTVDGQSAASQPAAPDQQSENDVTAQETEVADTTPSLDSLTPKQWETLAAIRTNPEATQRELAEALGVSAPTVSNRVNAIPDFEWDDRLSFVENIIETADPETIEALESAQPTSESTDSATEDATPIEMTDGDGSYETTADTAETADDDTTDSSSDSDSAAADETDDGIETADSDAEGPVAVQSAQLETLAQRLDELNARLAAVDDKPTGNLFENSELTHKIIHACMETDTISEDEELEIIKRLT